MLEDIFYKIKDSIQSHKKLAIALLIVGVFVFMFYTMVQYMFTLNLQLYIDEIELHMAYH